MRVKARGREERRGAGWSGGAGVGVRGEGGHWWGVRCRAAVRGAWRRRVGAVEGDEGADPNPL